MGKLIDADALLDVLKNKYCDIVAGAYPFNIVVYDVVKIIESQPALTAGQEWISVKDRLPEDDVRVLVCANSNIGDPAIAITHYTHSKYGYNIEGWIEPWQYFFYNYEITHWMPLPLPPKGE